MGWGKEPGAQRLLGSSFASLEFLRGIFSASTCIWQRPKGTVTLQGLWNWISSSLKASLPLPARQSFSEILKWFLVSLFSLIHYFFNFIFFNWSRVNLQCCFDLWRTASWFCYTHTYLPFHILFYCRPLKGIEYGSLCSTVGPVAYLFCIQ